MFGADDNLQHAAADGEFANAARSQAVTLRVPTMLPHAALQRHDRVPRYAQSPSAFARDDDDARARIRQTLGHTLSLYALLGLALAGAIPVLALVVAVPLVYVRLSLALHELMHVRTASRVPAFHRLAMIFDTPLGLGYREHRAIHLAHHRYTATTRDPELYQIRGGHLRAFLCATFSPERHLVTWIRRRGMSRALAAEAAVRFALFFALALANPAVFFAYWATLRASIGGASFVFHHLLHSRGGDLGNFPLPFGPGVLRFARTAFGQEPVVILTEHRAHHLWPTVRARDLPRLAQARRLSNGN
jgi:fatty acid desaturase